MMRIDLNAWSLDLVLTLASEVEEMVAHWVVWTCSLFS